MSLGLPAHLVRSASSRALARSAHWFGLICLVGALASVPLLSTTGAGSALSVTVLVMLGMAGLLVLLARHRTVLFSLAYLIIGTAGVYLYADTVLSVPAALPASTVFLIALPKMALIMVGGAGSGLLLGVLWSTAGFVLAEAAAWYAIMHADARGGPDVFTISAYVFLTAVLLLAGLGRRRGALAQQALLRAAEEDAASKLKDVLDNRAIALINDTAVTQLVALAQATPGTVSPAVETGLRGTLQTLRDTDWLTDADPHEPGNRAASALFHAVERQRAAGLTVDVAGQTAALDSLTGSVDRELALAVEHCLGNVLLHAGVTAAEVSVESDDDTVSVMVADAGTGFTLTGSSRGRLGLRQSVRRRVDRVGGSVEIWTRPGAGTTVRLTVPVAAPNAAPGPNTAPGPPVAARTGWSDR